jgi:hypothetical protein
MKSGDTRQLELNILIQTMSQEFGCRLKIRG